MPHRTPNLSVLLMRAENGDSARAVKAFLDAGGSSTALTQAKEVTAMQQLPFLHNMVLANAHPHKYLAESVQLLIDAGADIDAKMVCSASHNERTALMLAVKAACCTEAAVVLLRAGADPCVLSAPTATTALHMAAATGLPKSCELLLAEASTVVGSERFPSQHSFDAGFLSWGSGER